MDRNDLHALRYSGGEQKIGQETTMTKTTTYKFDNDEVVARSPKELVRSMHERAWAQSKDDQEFMHATADRLVVQSSIEVRYDTAEHFVEDLIKFGVVTVQP